MEFSTRACLFTRDRALFLNCSSNGSLYADKKGTRPCAHLHKRIYIARTKVPSSGEYKNFCRIPARALLLLERAMIFLAQRKLYPLPRDANVSGEMSMYFRAFVKTRAANEKPRAKFVESVLMFDFLEKKDCCVV